MRSSFYNTESITFVVKKTGILWNVATFWEVQSQNFGKHLIVKGISMKSTLLDWPRGGVLPSIFVSIEDPLPYLVPGLSWNTSSRHGSATILSPTSEPGLGGAAGRSQREPRLGGEKGDPWRSLQGTSLRSTPTSVLHLEKSSHPFRNQTQKSQCITWISCDLFLAKKAMVFTQDCETPPMKMVIEITKALMNKWNNNVLHVFQISPNLHSVLTQHLPPYHSLLGSQTPLRSWWKLGTLFPVVHK